MPDKKPHTIALRLTHDEWIGLQIYMRESAHSNLTEALRELLPVDSLAHKGREGTNHVDV